jgi:hypothetical protein
MESMKKIVILIIVLMLVGVGLLSGCTKESNVNNQTNVNNQREYFNEYNSSSYVDQYRIDALNWMASQDTNIADPAKRPTLISWWAYSYNNSIVGGHPIPGANFENGIPPTANFYLAKSEKEAVAIWIVRLLLEDINHNDGSLSNHVKDVLHNYLSTNKTNDIINWIENPSNSPSYQSPIGREYDEVLSNYHYVGDHFVKNAMYHDITEILNSSLDDEGITWLYHFLQDATHYSIRYFGPEGRDMDIFNEFGFFADKSLVLYALRLESSTQDYNPEDDFVKMIYTGYMVNADGTRGTNETWTAQELNDMTPQQKTHTAIAGNTTIKKQDYFKTMFYRTYIGTPPQPDNGQQIPCYSMKHFIPVYISPYLYYGTGRSAVVIAKYYEGALFNGTINCNNTVLPYVTVAILDGFGIPRDNSITDFNGNFHLIAPAGNITLLFSYANEVLLKKIIFNNINNILYSPVTDAEAMRLNGTNYRRNFNISVNLSTLEGFIYDDKNNNGSYEPAIDTPLSGITVKLFDYYFGESIHPVKTDAQGHYIFRNLYPSKYNISAVENNYTFFDKLINVVPDDNLYNISKL